MGSVTSSRDVAQPTRVQDLSAVNVTSQSQADRVNRNASLSDIYIYIYYIYI